MLDGLAAPDPQAGRGVRRRQRQHRPHPRGARGAAKRGDLPLQLIHSDDNLGGAGGFHLGVRLAYDAGYDRIWLMDDDVVPGARLPRRC